MCVGYRSVDGAKLDTSLIEGGTGSETAKKLRHAMEATSDHGGREVVRAGDDVGDDFGILGIGDGRFEDSDDGSGAVTQGAPAEAHSSAENGRIFSKSGCPETMRENDDAGSFGTVVLRSDETAEDRVQAHNFEVGAADHAGLHYARLTQTDHSETDGQEHGHARQ